MTEAEVLDLLRARHIRPGNGGAGEYAFLTHVRNAAGFGASRTFDAVAMSLWPSRGLSLHAFEVKCSRSDWLRELKDPSKAEEACRLVDRFSLVVADPKIVALGELPPTWGLLEVRGSRLVCTKDAPILPGADIRRPVSRSFLVALLRAGGATPSATAEEVAAARTEGYERGLEYGRDMAEAAKERGDALAVLVDEFEAASGVALAGWRARADAKDIGAAVRAALRGSTEATGALDSVRHARRQLLEAAHRLESFIPADQLEADDGRLHRRRVTR